MDTAAGCRTCDSPSPSTSVTLRDPSANNAGCFENLWSLLLKACVAGTKLKRSTHGHAWATQFKETVSSTQHEWQILDLSLFNSRDFINKASTRSSAFVRARKDIRKIFSIDRATLNLRNVIKRALLSSSSEILQLFWTTTMLMLHSEFTLIVCYEYCSNTSTMTVHVINDNERLPPTIVNSVKGVGVS